MADSKAPYQRAQRPTLKEVARFAGVSSSAVAVVLNGARSGTRVSEETRATIIDAARRLGYQANVVAQSLRKRRTGLIGLYTDFEFLNGENCFLAELVGGLQEACSDHGLDLVLRRFDSSWGEAEVVRHLTDHRVDALAFYSPPDNRLSRALAEVDVPCVALVEPTPYIPCVVVDDLTGGRAVADHLFALGHRHALVRSWVGNPSSMVRRWEAFAARCAELGMRVSIGRVIDFGRQYQLSPEERAWVTDPHAPATAFFCLGDPEAHSTLVALERDGWGVPEQISVMGFNGLSSPWLTPYTLSTVRAPWRQVGARALDLLMTMLRGGQVPLETVLAVTPCPGTTTGPARPASNVGGDPSSVNL